ncbi:MAG: LytTR family DNA-binding domain-containing protein [Bacteroidota bacterium]
MKLLIVEDEFYTRQGLITLVNSFDKGIEIVGDCATIDEAIIHAYEKKPDLVLLDINLPDGDGFDFVDQTKDLRYQIIFITAHDNFAIKAIREGAIDYIMKPVEPQDLEAALERVLHNYIHQSNGVAEGAPNEPIQRDKLFLSFNDCIQVISFKQLMYCSSDNGYTTFFLANGQSFLSSKPLKDFEHEFPVSNFVRTHQSFIVNLDYVCRYQKEGYCVLNNDEKVPVSVRRKKHFMTKLMQ